MPLPFIPFDSAGADGAPLPSTPLGSEPEPKSDLVGAAIRGVKASFIPFQVDKEDVNKPRTGTELAVETAANVGSDIASSVALGAATGAAVGSVLPGAGTIAGTLAGAGLGIYRALGYEDMQSRAKGEKFNVGRAALNVATEINPLLKVGGKALKFGTQGALQALQTLAYGGSGEAAAISGVIGGAIGAVGHRNAVAVSPELKDKQVRSIATMLADQDLGSDGLQKIINELDHNDNSFQLARRAFDSMKANSAYEDTVGGVLTSPTFFNTMQDAKAIKSAFDTIPDNVLTIPKGDFKGMLRLVLSDTKAKGVTLTKQEIITQAKSLAKQTVMEQEAASFARWVTKDFSAEIGPELFQKAQQKLGTSSLDAKGAYDIYRTQHYLKDAATKAANQAAEEGAGIKDPLGLTVFRFFSDLKFAFRAVDRTAGTNLDGLANVVAHQKNLHGTEMYKWTSRTNTLLKQAKKAKLDRNTIVDLLESGADKTHVDAAHRQVLAGFRELFDDIRTFGVKNKLDIGLRENYVTHIAQEPAELITTIRRRAVSYEGGAARIKPEALHDTELHKVLEHVTGVKVGEPGNEAASGLIQRALNKLDALETIKDADGFEAIAAFQRKGSIPDFVRERDIGKILVRYSNNMSKSVHMEPVIRMLQSQVPALEALGLQTSADYLKRYVGRLSGKESEFAGWMSAANRRWKTSIDEIIDVRGLTGAKAGAFNAAKFTPDFISWSVAQIYPNFLGLSAKAIIRNSTQPFATISPELGGEYGYRVVFKASMEALADKKAKVDFEDVLQKLGHAPGKHIGEGANPIANTLRNTPMGAFTTKVDEVSGYMMWAYAKSDVINRYITLKVAKTVSSDMLEAFKGGNGKNHQAAMRVLRELGQGTKSEIYALVKSNQFDKLEGVLAEHLLSKTQFNYGPHALSEYGATMGRFFSMFTKWPAMVAGNTHELLSTKQYAKVGRYLGPWAALGALNMWMMDTQGDPRKRALLGKSLTGFSPLSSLSVSMPPSLEILGGAGKSFMDAASFDFGSAKTSLKNALTPLIPGLGLVHGAENAINILTNKEAPWSSR